jgi:hypothetical protein
VEITIVHLEYRGKEGKKLEGGKGGGAERVNAALDGFDTVSWDGAE